MSNTHTRYELARGRRIVRKQDAVPELVMAIISEARKVAPEGPGDVTGEALEQFARTVVEALNHAEQTRLGPAITFDDVATLRGALDGMEGWTVRINGADYTIEAIDEDGIDATAYVEGEEQPEGAVADSFAWDDIKSLHVY